MGGGGGSEGGVTVVVKWRPVPECRVYNVFIMNAIKELELKNKIK